MFILCKETGDYVDMEVTCRECKYADCYVKKLLEQRDKPQTKGDGDE